MKCLFAFLCLLAPGALAGSVIIQNNSVTTDGGGNSVVIINGHTIEGDVTTIDATGPIKTQARDVPAYSSLGVSAPVIMEYAVSDTPSLEVTAPADALAYIKTQVHGDRLTIKIDETVTLRLHEPIRVKATGRSLSAVSLSGSGIVTASGLKGADLSIDIGGSGSFTASGEIGDIVAAVSGSGDIDIRAVKARVLHVDVSGSGNVAGFASESVDAEVAGSGNIEISGHPRRKNIEKSGSGQVTFI